MALENAELPIIGNGGHPGSTPAPETERHDTWWAQPAATFIVFTAFIIYATYRTFENGLYETYLLGPHYLSPFYSPTLGKGLRISGFDITPALWILPFPLLFRGTCYYYRKAYYRAFFWDPPACAVSEPGFRKHYTGEREFPWILQNIHRYTFYAAVVILAILWWDAFDAFRFTETSGDVHFFVGVGSIIFLINVVLLTLYTFSCHSWRHLIGGNIDCFSCSASNKSRHGIWQKVSHFNENHALWAWLSLFSVALTDFYVRCVAANVFNDHRFI